jgi:teichuronic acid biosynthesis glycosyltransferase TuaG
MSKLISVVIPAYNREKLIQKCIDSVLAQTYYNIEVIVVDDCSVDHTADIVDEYNDPRVKKCIRLPHNSGACYARNMGADCAMGEYIAFQDSDDIWYPEKLDKQLKFMNAGNYNMVFCGMKRINHFINKEWYFPLYDFNENEDRQKQILHENCVSTQCILIKKEAFDRIRFDNTIKKYQDWDFAIRAAEYLRMGYLKESLVVAEVQENSVSRKTSRFDALSVLYKKYYMIISADPRLNAHFLKQMGDELYGIDNEKAFTFYKRSLKQKIHIKTCVKLVLCSLGYNEKRR